MNIFVDLEDLIYDKIVDVIEVIKIIRESKIRLSMLFWLVNNNFL